MSEKTIQITVSPEGTVNIKTTGFSGSSCRDATRDIERALGVSGTEHLMPEFYNQTSTGDQVRQGN